jgi:hypothetical protein
MTRKKGRVVVAVEMPVFGRITGTKTMEEVISGERPEQEQHPAVKTRPLPGSQRAAAAPKPASPVRTP